MPATPFAYTHRALATVRVLALALAAGLGAGAPAAQAEPLGRLFFTPERREALERQREFKVQQEQVIESANLSVGGVVARSDGRRTVWLNGTPYHDNAAAGDVAAHATRDPAKVRLQAGDTLDTTLRVGQSIDRNSGARDDLLRGGQLVVRGGATSPAGR